jgi:glycosyltransferase involved in cell wall biosynthesis
MRLSIVIPTFNRAHLLPQILPSLKGQTAGDFSYEVLFISNGSTDGTEALLKDLVASAPQTFRYFWIEPTGGPSAPRNFGIREATGDIIIIIDDDVIPHPDLVLRHAEFHRQHPAAHEAAVGEVYVPEHLMDDPMSLFHAHYSYTNFQERSRLNFLDFWTCNVSFKRQFMLDHGMFDVRILDLEDIEVGYRLECAGMHLYHLPVAKGQHIHQTNPARIATRARHAGAWLYRIAERVPGAVVQKRWGIVTPELGPLWCIKRVLRFGALLALDNPITRMILRLLGATRSKRSRITDAYYALMFQRAFLTGYYKAWFDAWRQRPTEIPHRA